jgi:hypothetical protein
LPQAKQKQAPNQSEHSMSLTRHRVSSTLAENEPTMPSPYESFLVTVDRATQQIQSAGELIPPAEKRKHPIKSINDHPPSADLVRFSVVLSIAAMDDYFTRKYAEVLVPCLKRHGIKSEFISMLEHAGLDLAGSLELISMDRPYRRIRKIAQDFYKGYSTQSTQRIDDLFKTIGISGLSEHAQRRAKRRNLLQSIELFVKRRHQIVHAGDLNRRGTLQPIELNILNKSKDVVIFVMNAEDHINKYVKQKKS